MVERKLEGSKLGINVKIDKNAPHYGNKPSNFQEGRDKIYSKSGERGLYKERRQYSDIDMSTFPRSRRSIDIRV